MLKDERLRELIPCLLEMVQTAEAMNRPIQLRAIANELKRPLTNIERAMEIALKEGLIERKADVFKLTEKGRIEIQKHRERYVHEKYAHRPRILGGIVKFFEGKIKNWRGHWRHRHGLNDKALDAFYSNLRDFSGRVEDAVPLVNLREGERGVVAFMMGGYGIIRRLAEMGLTPGTEVRVIGRGLLRGPFKIEIRGVSLALGYGVASRVFVKPLQRGD